MPQRHSAEGENQAHGHCKEAAIDSRFRRFVCDTSEGRRKEGNAGTHRPTGASILFWELKAGLGVRNTMVWNDFCQALDVASVFAYQSDLPASFHADLSRRRT